MPFRPNPLYLLLFLPFLWWGCDQQQVLEVCRMSAITTAAGDTLMTLEYEDSSLVRIDERNPTQIRRFKYDNGFLVREESFGASGVLQSFRSFFYNSDSQNTEIFRYELTPDGEWRPVAVIRFSSFEGQFPTVSRSYLIQDNQESLSAYHEYSWLNGSLNLETRLEQIPSNPSALRVAEKTVYIYDTRPSPWSDIPAISPWLRTRAYASITKTLLSYLPDGSTQETVFTQTSDNRFDREGILQESLVTSFSGEEHQQLFLYSCEEFLP